MRTGTSLVTVLGTRDAQRSHRVTVARTGRSRMHDYITFIIVAVCAVIGAGLFRVGLMNLKVGSPEDIRRARPFIALGIAVLQQCSS